jgi:tRNA acetyltransferase TAN1
MLEDFNLLASTSRLNEKKACNELWYLLREIGDNSPNVRLTNVSGLIISKTNLDPVQVISQLHLLLIQKPWEFRYILKIRPVQFVVPTDLEEIGKKIEDHINTSIANEESFRITVNKRNCEIRSMKIIDKIAEKIDRKVNLKKPDKIVLIEIIGQETGISIIPPSAILSVERERRNI